jgi:hypothetical protein
MRSVEIPARASGAKIWSAQILTLLQEAAELEEELRRKSVVASWRDGGLEKSTTRRKQISRLEE